MKNLLSSMAAATLCLGMFAFSPVSASDSVDNVQVNEFELAARGTCVEAYETGEGVTKCIKTFVESDEQRMAIVQEAEVLATI